MSSPLVLSLFPGIGILDKGFEEQGFCVVRGPDLLWGGDIRLFHPPAGVFDGVIGGPPCQEFSALARIVKHKGLKPKWGNLIPEFERVVREAAPRWFVMENVVTAPIPQIEGFVVDPTILDNRWLGGKQRRKPSLLFWDARRTKGALPDRGPPAVRDCATGSGQRVRGAAIG